MDLKDTVTKTLKSVRKKVNCSINISCKEKQRKAAAERKRRQREKIRNDPEKYKKSKEAEKERSRKRREEKYIKSIGDLSEKGKRLQRARWRKKYHMYAEKRRAQTQIDNYAKENPPSSSIDLEFKIESIDLPSVKEENVSDDEGVNQLSKPFEEYYYEDDNHYENATSFVLEMCEEKGPLCRICACSSTQLIDIFSMQGRKMQILKKIHIHLPIMVIEQDVLPTYICPDCINTLDRCHSFIIKCLEADVQLKRIHGLEELIEEESERKGAKFSLNDVLKTMILHWRLMIDTSEAPAPSSDNDNNEASDEEEDGNAENYAHSDSENNEDTETGEEIAEQDIETKNITQNATELDTGSEMVVIKQPKVMTVDVLNPRTGLNEKVSVLDTTVDAAKKVFCCCKACDVMFSSLVGFVSHQIRVHNVKMFSCSSCSTILNTSDASFIQHLSTCEKKKPGNIPTGDLSSKQQSRSIGSSKTGKFSKQLDDVERFLSRLPTDKENLETGGKVEIIEMSDNKRNMESGEVSEFMSKGNVGKPDIRGSKNKEKISSLKNKLKTNEMERKAITYFSCSLCKKKFIRRRQFMLHCKTEHSGASVPCVVLKHYPCNLCKVNFASYEKLKSHKEKHFSVKGAFNCADCGKLCTTKLSIINHLKKHQAVTTDAEKKHLCEVCGKECKDQKALKYHQETHSEQDYICDICGKTVKHIKQHRQKHNREKIRYECTICGKSYDRKQSLLDHLRGHGEPNFKCPECPKSFHSSSKLSQHLRQHDEVPRYKCDFCDRRFRRNSHKRLHLKTHNREKTFTCKVCLKVFKSLGEVLVHRKEHTEEEIRRSEMENPARTYICNVCGKIYTNWPNFQYHYQLHTGEKPEHCTICNASFRYKVSLQTHMLTHTGEKPFVCKVCDKSFRSRRTLDQHSKLHSSERPFACGTCGKSFIRRETLEIHMRIHTNERPYACKFCAKAFKQLTDRKRHEERHYRQVNKDVWKYVKVMDNKQAIRKT